MYFDVMPFSRLEDFGWGGWVVFFFFLFFYFVTVFRVMFKKKKRFAIIFVIQYFESTSLYLSVFERWADMLEPLYL